MRLHNLKDTVYYNYRWVSYATIDVLTGLVSIHYQYPSIFITIYLFIFIYYFFITSVNYHLIVIILISSLLYLVFKQDHQWFIYDIVTLSYHFILAYFLGKYYNPHGRFFVLPFNDLNLLGMAVL